MQETMGFPGNLSHCPSYDSYCFLIPIELSSIPTSPGLVTGTYMVVIGEGIVSVAHWMSTICCLEWYWYQPSLPAVLGARVEHGLQKKWRNMRTWPRANFYWFCVGWAAKCQRPNASCQESELQCYWIKGIWKGNCLLKPHSSQPGFCDIRIYCTQVWFFLHEIRCCQREGFKILTMMLLKLIVHLGPNSSRV